MEVQISIQQIVMITLWTLITRCIIIATDESKASKFNSFSKRQFDVKLNNLGKGVKWEGGTMEGQKEVIRLT